MIVKNKFIFYLLSWTWGIIMTAIGGIIAAGLLIAGYKPKKHGHCIYFEVGKGWGGVELGMFFLTSKDAGKSTRNHEHGHGFQNTVLGPAFPFLVAIPSATRYWLRECSDRKSKTIFSVILYLALITIAAILLVTALYTQPWVFIFPIFIALYATILFGWLIIIEIPKYDKGYVDYDAIWFEGSATKLGDEFMSTFDKNN